jgi:hypothetical protein
MLSSCFGWFDAEVRFAGSLHTSMTLSVWQQKTPARLLASMYSVLLTNLQQLRLPTVLTVNRKKKKMSSSLI